MLTIIQALGHHHPSHETDIGSDMMRNDGQKGDNANAKHKGAELARSAILDLKLNNLAKVIAKVRNIASRLLFIALLF